MKQVWAPWRMEYIMATKQRGCFFCECSKEARDGENYILYRGGNDFVILNSYPYNVGHLMVATYRHVGNLVDLTVEELEEHFKIVSRAVEMLTKAFQPQGFNIGINIGKVAGAGVEDHIHTHVVPRWLGDTNYMPVVADTKVVPETLRSSYNKLKDLL